MIEWNDTETTGGLMGGYPAQTLVNWRHRGIGPPYTKYGKHVKYHWPTVERWMLDQQVQPRNSDIDVKGPSRPQPAQDSKVRRKAA